jgi:hypothetical protein
MLALSVLMYIWSQRKHCFLWVFALLGAFTNSQIDLTPNRLRTTHLDCWSHRVYFVPPLGRRFKNKQFKRGLLRRGFFCIFRAFLQMVFKCIANPLFLFEAILSSQQGDGIVGHRRSESTSTLLLYSSCFEWLFIEIFSIATYILQFVPHFPFTGQRERTGLVFFNMQNEP